MVVKEMQDEEDGSPACSACSPTAFGIGIGTDRRFNNLPIAQRHPQAGPVKLLVCRGRLERRLAIVGGR